MGLCARRLGTLACLLATAPAAHAQLAPVGVPRGVVRLELDARMDIWDTEFLDGTRVPLGAAASSPALGSALLPSLADADSRLERLTGVADYHLNLGALTTDELRDEGRGNFGVSLGLTRAITVFGRLPLVRARAQATLSLDPAASDAGLNPGADLQSDFFNELDAALTTLSTNISSGAYNGDPARLALAQSTLASANALGSDLFGLLADPATASPFVPVSSSAAGTAVQTRVAALQATLAGSLGVTGFSATPVFPSAPVTGEDFSAFLRSPTGPGTRAGGNKLTYRGDAETGVALTLLDHWDREGRRGGFRAAVEGLVRFPTGVVPRADRLFAVGTGDGQTDLEMRITADLGAGNVGVRVEGDYNRQLPGDLVTRVAAPTQPFAGSGFITTVRNDPGDITTIAARPFFRLARTLAIQGTAMRWSRGADNVSYASTADEIAGVDAAILATDTRASATILGIGLTYANPGAYRPGYHGLPVDAGWSYERVVKATGGRVANTHAMSARLRVYFGLF